LLEEGLRAVRELGDRRWEARAIRQLAIVHRNDGDTDTAITMLAECMSIFGELEDRRGMAVVFRNRGDAYRLAGDLDEAGSDLSNALETFQAIDDRRWIARTRLSIAGLARLRRDWTAARQHLDAAVATFRAIGDRPAEARALRELGMLLRDQGEVAGSGTALSASQEIYEELGDVLWTARVLASQAALDERGHRSRARDESGKGVVASGRDHLRGEHRQRASGVVIRCLLRLPTQPVMSRSWPLSRFGKEISPRFAHASRAARAAVEVTSERETAIRDVAAGVAAPALVGFVLWTQEQSRLRGLRRLRFLSRGGQVLYELTRRLARVLGAEMGLEYVYSSRLTWSLAATQPDRLADAPWLFNSFIKSNAADVCARLGLPLAQYRPAILTCGVSLEPDARADQPGQAGALLRYVGTPVVARAVGARIEAMRRLVLDRYTPARPAIRGAGLRRPWRPCVACGIIGIEYPRSPGGVPEPCSGARACWRSGDGFMQSGQ